MGVRGALPRWCAILAATVVGLLVAGASPAAAPDNDNFSAAASLRAATGTVFGTNVDATVEAGEPAHTGNAGGASAWYRWVAPYTGVATFDTFGSGFDTLLAVYTGSSVNALTPVASNDDALGFKWTSQAGFPVTAGTAYYVAVDGYNDGTNGPARGTFALNWDLAPSAGVTQPNDMFASAVPLSGPAGSVAGSSFGATSESGEPIHAAVGGGRSVWFRWTAPYDAQFTFSTDGSAFNTVLAAYTGIAVNGLSQTAADDDIAWNDQQSLITINASQGTTYSIAIDGWKTTYSGTASGDYLLTWMPLSPPQNVPANDAFVNSQSLSGASGAVSSSSLSAGKEPGEPNHGGNLGGASVWYSWTAPVSGNVDVSTAGSNFDTLLGVYTGTAVNALSQVAGNDDVGPGKGPSEVVFAATAGTTYRIAVDGYSAPGGLAGQGDFVLAWSVAAGAAPSNDDFDSAMTIVGTGGIVNKSNLGATKEPGEPAHASNAGGASVWFRYVAPADGQWRFYTSGSTFNTLLAVYTGDSVDQLSLVAANDDVSATDRSSSVTITARAQTTYWIAVDGYRTANGPAASGDYSFLWELLGPDPALAPNDDFAWAWQLNGSYGPVTASNVLATKQAGEPDHAGNAGGASVWFKWTPPSSGPVYFDTPGSSFDTTLAVYTGTSLNDLHEVAANDNIAYNLWWPTGQYRESYVSFYAQLGTIYYIAVDGHADPGGAPARGSIFLDWWLSSPPGDATLLAAGSISRCDAANDEATGALLGQYPDATVAALGDLTNVAGTAAEFGCYDQSWGAAKSRTRPVPGNQDYGTAGAAPYYSYFGAQAGAQGLGYYSYDLGGWHVVALNTNCSQVGGCGAGSPEEQWLRQDLRANANSCTVAYMHDSLFTSSGQPATAVQPLWQALYDNGADLVLSGDSHYYERFAPQTPAGAADSTKGIAEFIVGTGGAALTSLPSTRAANSQVVNASSYGVLKLLLHPSGYEWQFLPAGGSTFTDTGRGACAGGGYKSDPISAAAPAAPTVSKTLTSTGQFSVSWKASADIPAGATYTLWRRSTGSTTYTQVGGSLTSTTYTFGSSSPEAEGTWVYRVQATDATHVSAYSADSSPVVVDKTAPLPPTVKPDRTAEYAAGNWWKDKVTVSYPDNGDPKLADGTPGSGVNTSLNKAPTTYSTSGSYTASAQATDYAGLKSTTSSATIKVDTGLPSVTLTCPSSVGYRTTRTASYSASDSESGLATPSSGTVTLDTSSRGTKSASVTAKDKVGHSRTATCTYSVN